MEIFHSLSANKHFRLFGASSVADHGRVLFAPVYDLPYITSQEFLPSLNLLIDELDISYVYPAHDDVLLYLSENSGSVKAEIIAPDAHTCVIARSKTKTYEALKRYGFTPEVFTKSHLNDLNYPVFVRPDKGQGSQGALRIDSEQQIRCYLEKRNEVVITEYLPGKEYTVDCFTNRKQELVYVRARERMRTRSGIAVNSRFIDDSSLFREYAEAISCVLDFRGAWFFQMKENREGDLKLLEIGPRIAGTMGLSRSTGTNLCSLALYDRQGLDIEIYDNNLNMEVERAFVSRYMNVPAFDRVYIDLDDTIIINNRVNKTIVMLLYQWHDKEIILLTRHKNDPLATLAHFKISSSIFSKVIKIPEDDEKHRYIDNKKPSIFIDDSFSERSSVLRKCRIPVFDVNEVDGLIDWRPDI